MITVSASHIHDMLLKFRRAGMPEFIFLIPCLDNTVKEGSACFLFQFLKPPGCFIISHQSIIGTIETIGAGLYRLASLNAFNCPDQ